MSYSLYLFYACCFFKKTPKDMGDIHCTTILRTLVNKSYHDLLYTFIP